VTEADFLAQVDRIAVEAFDDQCTGANPRFPLISELRTLLLDSYYGRAFSEPSERIVAVAREAIAAPKKTLRKAAGAAA
jgi:acetaldehyde dehydrogenase/alcohol dehydrogenase